MTYFGEGASNQGQVYESFNLAALMKLPCVYVIENNRTAWAPAWSARRPSHDLSKNGAPWGIPGRAGGRHGRAGGAEAAAEVAVAHCRAGKGPYLLEMKTYRYRGHSMSDPAQVPHARGGADDAHAARLHRGRAARAGGARASTRTTFKAIDDEVKAIVQEAAEFAQSSPEPDPAELWTDVLVEG